MKRFLIGTAAGAIVLVSLANSAFAAKPNNQACLGKDVSGYAEGGAGFGGFVSGVAKATTGVGAEIQAHLAGDVPDYTIPNSCNN